MKQLLKFGPQFNYFPSFRITFSGLDDFPEEADKIALIGFHMGGLFYPIGIIIKFEILMANFYTAFRHPKFEYTWEVSMGSSSLLQNTYHLIIMACASLFTISIKLFGNILRQ